MTHTSNSSNTAPVWRVPGINFLNDYDMNLRSYCKRIEPMPCKLCSSLFGFNAPWTEGFKCQSFDNIILD